MSPGCKAKRNLVISWGFPAKTYSCDNFKLETSEGIKVKIEKIIFAMCIKLSFLLTSRYEIKIDLSEYNLNAHC